MRPDPGSPPEKFQAGDRVQYRAGGPAMHVISAAERHCYCNWVDAFGELQHGTFEQQNLDHAWPDSGAPAPE